MFRFSEEGWLRVWGSVGLLVLMISFSFHDQARALSFSLSLSLSFFSFLLRYDIDRGVSLRWIGEVVSSLRSEVYWFL